MKLMPQELRKGMTIILNSGRENEEAVTLARDPALYHRFMVIQTTDGRMMECNLRKRRVVE